MKITTVTLLALVSLCSCVPVTPAARIEQSRARFEALPVAHQELVRQGRIERGMTSEAVRFAWGVPDSVMAGSHGGRDSERWDYTRLRPVFFDGYAWPGYVNPWFPQPFFAAPAPGPAGYIPVRSATVWFIGGKVDAWERLQ